MSRRRAAVRQGAWWLVCAWLGTVSPVQAQSPEGRVRAHTVVGKLEEKVVDAPEPIGSRRLYVLLPPDLDPAERYPVIYALDGQDLFDATTAAGREEWGIDELLDARPPGIPSVIVVGIEAAPHAILDMAPPGSTDGARADLFARFLAEVVKPFVDRTYPTRSGPGAAVLLGRGPAALFSIYAAWTRSDVFGAAIALELPDVDRASLEWIEELPSGHPHLWIEQSAGDAAVRPSATDVLDALRRGARVDYSMGSGATTPLVLVGVGLRAVFSP